MELDVLNKLADEEYVIQRAKSALLTDPLSAKAWMLTAKTLYPNNFGVQVCTHTFYDLTDLCLKLSNLKFQIIVSTIKCR